MHLRLWAIVYMWVIGFNSGVGTNLVLRPYYLVAGISWIDIIIIIAGLRLLLIRRGIFLSRSHATLGLGTVFLAFWLMLCTALNAWRFETMMVDFLPMLKLLYLIILATLVADLVSRHGVRHLILGASVGVFLVAFQDMFMSTANVNGIPLLTNPNVTGALLGQGAAFAVFYMVFTGSRVQGFIIALLMTALSVTSFSKGAWLMCACACLAAGAVSVDAQQETSISRARRALTALILLTLIGVAAQVVLKNQEVLGAILDLKIETSVDGGSVSSRFGFVMAAVYAALENPLFGLGYRNFYHTQWLYPQLQLPSLERGDNAHNVFAETLATGGFPAALLLVLVFAAPFMPLWRLLGLHMTRMLWRAVVWLMLLAVWTLYGAVQLQLVAQPTFWLMAGMVFGMNALGCKSVRRQSDL